jgi:Rps23 Pro-64 3,4-dihydroxylase Tpa1-like proline 4-hydroxylase
LREKDLSRFILWTKIYNWNSSIIFWHNDGGWYFGITYYLNKRWDPNWGGELLLRDGRFVAPIGNRIVFVKTPMVHKTSLTIEGADPRLTLQSFIGFRDDE